MLLNMGDIEEQIEVGALGKEAGRVVILAWDTLSWRICGTFKEEYEAGS